MGRAGDWHSILGRGEGVVKVEASSAGISKVLKMAEKPNTKKARAAINQKKYRNKLRELHETHVRFMAFVSERAPWLVAEFFAEENKVSNIDCKLRWLFSLHSLQHFVNICFIASF